MPTLHTLDATTHFFNLQHHDNTTTRTLTIRNGSYLTFCSFVHEAVTAYHHLGAGTMTTAIATATTAAGPASPLPVAVRSSATAEDLSDASFAGQQETYLNVRIRRCKLAAHCWLLTAAAYYGCWLYPLPPPSAVTSSSALSLFRTARL